MKNKKGKYALYGAGIILVLFIVGVSLLRNIPVYKMGTQRVEDVENLHMYDSRYTYAEKNEDGTYNLYIYASPIQWRDGTSFQIIDNSIIDSKLNDYSYENASNEIKTYLPKNISKGLLIHQNKYKCSFLFPNYSASGRKESFVNLYGEEKEAISYKNVDVEVYIYPIYTGFHIEYIFKDGIDENKVSLLQWRFDHGQVKETNSEYMLLDGTEGHLFVVSSPMVYLEDGEEYLLDAEWVCSKADKSPEFNVQGIDKTSESVHVAFSIQLHEEDMPDTTVYEKSQENVYLADKAIIGNHAYTGEGIHYLRYRLNYFFTINEESILEAAYYTRKLSYADDIPELKMYYPETQWSSTQMLWRDRVGYKGEQCTEIAQGKDYWVKFELTDFVKEAFSDESWMTESLGSVITAKDGYSILASSDNGEYIPYLCLKLKELPDEIRQQQTINEID